MPEIFGVLTTDALQQALQRVGIKSNLGWSYGLQALEMGSLMMATLLATGLHAAHCCNRGLMSLEVFRVLEVVLLV